MSGWKFTQCQQNVNVNVQYTQFVGKWMKWYKRNEKSDDLDNVGDG